MGVFIMNFVEFLVYFILIAPVLIIVCSPLIAGILAIIEFGDVGTGLFAIFLWLCLAIWAACKAGAI